MHQLRTGFPPLVRPSSRRAQPAGPRTGAKGGGRCDAGSWSLHASPTPWGASRTPRYSWDRGTAGPGGPVSRPARTGDWLPTMPATSTSTLVRGPDQHEARESRSRRACAPGPIPSPPRRRQGRRAKTRCSEPSCAGCRWANSLPTVRGTPPPDRSRRGGCTGASASGPRSATGPTRSLEGRHGCRRTVPPGGRPGAVGPLLLGMVQLTAACGPRAPGAGRRARSATPRSRPGRPRWTPCRAT